jgi:hypothetical protein
MTEYSSKTLRAAMKAKASRLASGSDATKIGASDFTPAEALNADVQTGARPLTRRRFKSGGKVVGAANAPRADKKKRGNADLSADSFINRNVVEANEEREGKKHIGAFKKGGRAKHATDGKVPMPPKMPPDIRASRAMEAAKSSVPERDPSIPTAAEEARMRATSAASTAANAADARRQAEKDRFDAIGQKRGGKAEADCGSGGMKKGGRTKKAGGGAEQVKKTLRDAEDADRNMQSMGSSSGSMGQTMGQASPSMGMDQAQYMGGMKKGGRAKKFMGGPMMQPGGSMQPMGGMMKPEPNKDNPADMVEKNRFNFGSGAQGSPYKKGGKVAFEGSSKDAMQDTKLAKKYGMSMMAWEKSKQDKKHDEQESMTGLKKGGRAKKAGGGGFGRPDNAVHYSNKSFDNEFDSSDDGEMVLENLPNIVRGRDKLEFSDSKPAPKYTRENQMPQYEYEGDDEPQWVKRGGKIKGRAARASGGKTGKGKTNIEIVINTGKRQPQGGMMPNNGGMPPKQPPAMPVQAAPAAGMPPMAGAGAPPPQMPAGGPPQMPAGLEKLMQRKAGGRVYKSYKDMDAGSGSGMGRLEKTEIAKRTAHKHGGKTYKSYKDMDAGAASGMGRLEKTEIAARGR